MGGVAALAGVIDMVKGDLPAAVSEKNKGFVAPQGLLEALAQDSAGTRDNPTPSCSFTSLEDPSERWI